MRLKAIIQTCSVIGFALLLSAAGPGGCGWGNDPSEPPVPPQPINQIRDAGPSQDAGDDGADAGDNGADAGRDGCAVRCRIAAGEAYQECIDNNGSEEDCRQRAGEMNRNCVAERCNRGNDADAGHQAGEGCAERCRIAAGEAYQECIDNNGSEEDCRRRAGEFNEQCVSDRCGGGRGGDDDCENHCDIGTRNAYQECIDNNGSVEDCRRRAGEYNEQCMRHCGEPTPCRVDEDCERDQQCVRNQCVDR
jgi:hypothetical protein